MADGISESISLELCRHYLEEFGQILHNDVDKVLIIAGKSQPEFGGGKVLIPPAIVVGGRATRPSGKALDEIFNQAVLPEDPKESEGLSRGAKGRGRGA